MTAPTRTAARPCCPATPGRPVRSCSLPADARAGLAARTFTAATLRTWGAEAIVDDLTLAVAELFGNALRHGSTLPSACATPILLELVLLPRGVLCLVSDPSPVFPTVSLRSHGAADGLAEGGRGLQIVGALAAAWGCVRNGEEGGKTVWALFEA